MFERFTGDARAIVVQAQEQARRLGHHYIGCEHLLLAVTSTDEPASAVLREHGVTPEAVEAEIVRLIGLGQMSGLFGAADQKALASIGIDLDLVRERIEAAFGPGAFTRAVPGVRRGGALARLRRRRRCRGRPAATGPHASAGGQVRGHIPFTARAKMSLERALREAQAMHDNSIGVEHLTLALVAMDDGTVPPILSALHASQATLRRAVLDRYRRAS
jgi:ATP-dependent Clp protease ATP-binding subunit ClpA